MFNKGDIIELEIIDVSTHGKGIGKVDNFTFFVDGAIFGDKVKAEITKLKKNYGFARCVEILEVSPYKMDDEDICPYIRECGGCMLGELTYETQLHIKETQVKNKLERIANIDVCDIHPIVYTDYPYEYRNKAVMHISTDGLMTKKGGIVKPVSEPKIGFYNYKSHEVVDCYECRLQRPIVLDISDAVREYMREENIASYDPRWDKGDLRNLVVRTFEETDEVMVVLVSHNKTLPNVASLIQKLETVTAAEEYRLASVVLNVNKSKKLGGTVYGKENIVLSGKETITDIMTVGGAQMKFEVSPTAFYQVNKDLTAELYAQVLKFANIKGDETILDLYCGSGTIGLTLLKNILIENPQATAKVVGIELNKSSILDANRNAITNGIARARYIDGKAEEILPFLMGRKTLYKPNEVNERVKRHIPAGMEIANVDIAILDPPRSGCHMELLDAVVEAKADKIIYVSCDPATLSRDLKYFVAYGYEVKEVTPFDMFGHSGHVESVVLLTKVHN